MLNVIGFPETPQKTITGFLEYTLLCFALLKIPKLPKWDFLLA